MSEKNHNIILIIVFALLLVIPMLFINHNKNAVSVLENKGLATKPSIYNDDGSINTNFKTQFENYLNENIGFKDLAVEVNLIAKYWLFHELDIPNWLLGKDGNMFYTTGGEDIRTFAGQNKFSETQLEDITDCLFYMNQYFLQKYGCNTYNIFIPNKESIYPELYSPYVMKDEQGRMNQLTDYMRTKGLPVLDLTNIFIKNKGEQLYYTCYDASHWNLNGAYLGYRTLMEQIAKDYPDIMILDKDDFNIVSQSFSGLSHYYENVPLLNNCFNFEDTVFYYNLKKSSEVEVTEQLDGVELSPDLNFYHYHNKTLTYGKTLFIVGDSYIYSFIMPFLAESFTDTYFVRNTNSAKIIEIADKVHPSIFVFEAADRVISQEYFTTFMCGYEDFIIPVATSCLDIEPDIHIDSVNGIAYDPEMIYEPDENGNITVIGWAYDTYNNKKPKALLVKSSDGQDITQAGFFYREDLLKIDQEHGECAFSFAINKTDISSEIIGLSLISQDLQEYKEFFFRVNVIH